MTDFTAADVVNNVNRWCDANVEGNSMAARMGGLVDEATKMAREGAVTQVGDLTCPADAAGPRHHHHRRHGRLSGGDRAFEL
ncbi:MAG: hypothetical protein R3D84_08195 [Paracoccaceae bacterium]